MIALFCLCLALFASPLKSKGRLEAENAALRHQLIILRRKVRGRVRLTDGDRLFLIQLYRWFPSVLKAITIFRPETLVRWHRAGFRRYWRWKSRSLGGRPQIDADLRALIRRMSVDNPLWGAPRIHGELLKLGIKISQATVGRWMPWRPKVPLSFPKIPSARIRAMRRIRASSDAMLAVLHLLGMFVADLFKSRRRLEVENLFLRHQLNIALRRAPHRLRLRGSDRALLVWMTRLWPSLLGLSRVVQPDTILRWHRAGFRAYWRWKSRARPGRPRVSRELRELIQRMSKENPLWGAPRIHGELLKLGFEIAESTVSKYMIRHRGPPSQTWRTFLRNHADAIAAIDLCVVPTLTFECLFAFLVVGHGRRQLLWFAVTRHPTAEWLAQQIVEAFPWDTAPTYLVRDNDGAYGQAFTQSSPGDGDSGPTDLTEVALAESLC